jgi:SAM-dependent methyltransferase
VTGAALAEAGEIIRPRPLARTLSPARWSEYDQLLSTARELGWATMDLEQWLTAGGVRGRVLIIRHDVDQNPAAAIRMARLDDHHGVRGVWYFRWRTASPAAVARVVELGGRVGLHYESLTRLALERGLTAAEIDAPLIAAARQELRREVAAFTRRFGPIESISAHGDTRVPGVSNQILLADEDASSFGIRFDANQALSRHRLALWMTDRSGPEGGWEHRAQADEVLRRVDGPILCLTHPNNWCSGAALWSDRARSRVLPTPPLDAGRWRLGTRTRDDRPPSDGAPEPTRGAVVSAPRLRNAAPVTAFAPVAESMRREILRHAYDAGDHIVSESGLRTLETNSGLAETRAATLEELLAAGGLPSVRDRALLDLGCGFGSLALVFATRGARVTALDPNGERLQVGVRVAARHGLAVTWRTGEMGVTALPADSFDAVVMNNSFCYVIPRAARRRALRDALRALRPGGVLVLRNPARFRPLDPFTRLPLISLLPPRAACAASRLLGRPRSRVRLLSTTAARRELRRAGFADVRSLAPAHRGPLPAWLAAYQHLVARRGP